MILQPTKHFNRLLSIFLSNLLTANIMSFEVTNFCRYQDPIVYAGNVEIQKIFPKQGNMSLK